MFLILPVIEIREETGPLARMADVAVAQPPDLQQHRVIVAVDEDPLYRELVARCFSLHPQLPRERLKKVANPAPSSRRVRLSFMKPTIKTSPLSAS